MAFPIITDNSELAILKVWNYLGIAKIKLRVLNFNYPLMRKKYRLLSKKNVCRLKNIFKRVGYKRLEKENFINAVVDNTTLILLLAFLGLNKQSFY